MRDYTHIISGLLIGYFLLILFKSLTINIISNTKVLLVYFIFIIISSIFLDYFEELIFNNHKRQFHTLFILIIPVVIIFSKFPMCFPIGFGILAGFSSHLLLDLLTPHGCPLLYPVNSYYYKVFTKNKSQIKTGSGKERGFALCLLLVLLITIIGTAFLLPDVYGFIPSVASSGWSQNSSNLSYSDNHGYINVNLNIHEDEEKNLTFTDSDNHTSTLLIKNYDSSS